MSGQAAMLDSGGREPVGVCQRAGFGCWGAYRWTGRTLSRCSSIPVMLGPIGGGRRHPGANDRIAKGSIEAL